MKAISLYPVLVYLIFALSTSVECIRILPRGATSLIQTPNELLSPQASVSESSYSTSATLTVGAICGSAMEIYAAFGNDTITPFDSCNYTDILLGPSNSAFSSSVPDCLSDVADVFCTFEFKFDEGEAMSAALFDFVIGSISYCVNVISSQCYRT